MRTPPGIINRILDGFDTALGDGPDGLARSINMGAAAKDKIQYLQAVPGQLSGPSMWVELMDVPRYMTVFGGDLRGSDHGIAQAYKRKPRFTFGIHVAVAGTAQGTGGVERLYPFLDPAGKKSITRHLEITLRNDQTQDLFGAGLQAQLVFKAAQMLPEWQQVPTPGGFSAAAGNFALARVVVSFE